MIAVGDREAPLLDEGGGWDAAQRALLDAGLGDGLPLVVPTATRLARMLAGLDPALSFGTVPPLLGELTAEAVAYCCVLAGCVPAELPVVLTAAVASLEPEFNLLGIQTTTGTPTVAAVVHGPAARTLGMNAGTNCLGPGNRANACIGRALRLVLTNVGGARPGIGDMATMGQPGKYGFCFAEGAHALLPPLSVRRGLPEGQSAVTVIGVSGTLEVLPLHGAGTPASVLRPALAAMQGARLAGDGGKRREPGEQFLLLPPEMADAVLRHGWDLAAMQDFLWREAPDGGGARGGEAWPIARSPRDIQVILTGGAGVKMTGLMPWGGGTLSVTRPLLLH